MSRGKAALDAYAKRHAKLPVHTQRVMHAPTCGAAGCTETENLKSVYALGYVTVMCPKHYKAYLERNPSAAENAKRFKYAER